MSLWSFLGLADAESIRMVQAELEELKRKQTDQFSAGIAETQDTARRQEELLRSISGTLAENARISQEGLDAVQRQLQSIADAQELGRKLVEQKLNTVSTSLIGIAQTLRTLQKLESGLSGQDYALADITRQINKTVTMLGEAQDSLKELPAVKSYLYELWEAMKLVWVNELLDMAEEE